MHAPYRWGGKGERDPSTGQRVFDCSGLVTWALREVGGPDWRRRPARRSPPSSSSSSPLRSTSCRLWPRPSPPCSRLSSPA
ncbi:NlpC/P60 family protein [Myxococcus xanthus]|uniref:NlpC/P60 family protein n=1 Tax=Myxococcus xanthus TaxID=34 RepID=UPI001CED7132|nr:NlpC/P60 family protein [Myxococcus xanthus]